MSVEGGDTKVRRVELPYVIRILRRGIDNMYEKRKEQWRSTGVFVDMSLSEVTMRQQLALAERQLAEKPKEVPAD